MNENTEKSFVINAITKWRRAKTGEYLVLAMTPKGRRFFVDADNHEVGVRIPFGAGIQFNKQIECMGWSDGGGLRTPGGRVRTRQAFVVLAPQPIFGRQVHRLQLMFRGRPAFFLQHVRVGQFATMISTPILSVEKAA